jgi:hypothetical protein
MIREWQALKTIKQDPDGNCEPVIEFLASCDSMDCVLALGNNLRARTPDIKLKVLEALAETNRWNFGHKVEAPSGPALDAIEQVLVTALEDTDEVVGMSGSRNGKSFSDPRIGDMAACLLSERFPQRYTFDISASRKTRDRQRRECANVWRLGHNLSALPIPQSNAAQLSIREATKVVGVEWSAEGAKPAPAFISRVANLEGRNLKQEELVNLFTDFARRPQAGASGLEFKAIKDEDLTGVRLTLKLLPGSPPTEAQGWNVNERVTLGRKSLHSSSGGGTIEAYSSKDHWEDFEEAIKQALGGPSKTPFEISVRMAAGRPQSN